MYCHIFWCKDAGMCCCTFTNQFSFMFYSERKTIQESWQCFFHHYALLNNVGLSLVCNYYHLMPMLMSLTYTFARKLDGIHAQSMPLSKDLFCHSSPIYILDALQVTWQELNLLDLPISTSLPTYLFIYLFIFTAMSGVVFVKIRNGQGYNILKLFGWHKFLFIFS